MDQRRHSRLFNSNVTLSRVVFPLVWLAWMLVTFIIFVPMWCRRHPKWCNTHLYESCGVAIPGLDALDNENADRVEHALRSLAELPPANVSLPNATSQLKVIVVAKRRPYPVINGKLKAMLYLTQVVWRLLQLTNDKIAQSVIICNVDDQPEKFVEATNLSKYVSVWKKTDHIPARSDSATNASTTEPKDRLESEKADYSFCLRRAASQMEDDDLVIIFEDDALPVDQVGPMIRSVADQMRSRRKRYSDRFGSDSPPTFVKLYHPEQYRKIPWLIFVFAYSAALAILVEMIANFAKTRRPVCGIPIAGWLIFIYTSILLWCLGHESVAYIRYVLSGGSVYLVVQESCCTPAILYTRSAAVTVTQYLDEKTAFSGYAIDHMLDEIPNAIGLMTDVNLVRHIGTYTTLRSMPIESDPW